MRRRGKAQAGEAGFWSFPFTCGGPQARYFSFVDHLPGLVGVLGAGAGCSEGGGDFKANTMSGHSLAEKSRS